MVIFYSLKTENDLTKFYECPLDALLAPPNRHRLRSSPITTNTRVVPYEDSAVMVLSIQSKDTKRPKLSRISHYSRSVSTVV